MAAGRIAWIDTTKGLCIIAAVMMCAAFGYGMPLQGDGWMQAFAGWLSPFVVPAFFMIAGLFLHRTVFSSAATFLDRRVLHLVYFYALWLAIQTALLHAGLLASSPAAFARLYLTAWVVPEGPLWFIHLLAIFYLVTRAVRRLSATRIFVFACLLQMLNAAGILETGWPVADRFAAYFAFFFAGYGAVPLLFQFANGAQARARDLTAALVLWCGVHTLFVGFGIAGLPVISLILGFAGALGAIAAGALLARIPAAGFLAAAGRNCLPVYLGFFAPMYILQTALAVSGIRPASDLAVFGVALASIGIAMAMYRVARETPLRIFYVRPQALRLPAARSAQRGSLISTSAFPKP